MKLVHPSMEKHIELEENIVNVLVLEAPELFKVLTQELYSQCNGGEGSFVLSQAHNELEIAKFADITFNVFALDCNSRKIANKLYENLRKIAYDEEMYLSTQEITSKALGYLEKLAEYADYSLVHKEEIDIVDFLKIFDIEIDAFADSVLEKIVAYMEVMRNFLKIELFIFINIKSYLTEKELQELYKQAAYMKARLLLIEATTKEWVLEEEMVTVIDKDLCEIY